MSPLLLSLLLLLASFLSATVRGGGGGDDHTAYVEADVRSLSLSPPCPSHNVLASDPGGSAGIAAKVSHRYGPCSPHGGRKYNQTGLLLKLLRQDRLRVASLNKLLLLNSSSSSSSSSVGPLQTTLPAREGDGTGSYVVSLGIGTPPLPQTVLLDTGSSLSWVQCRPCLASCHPQAEPVFDPAASSTYRNLSCSSPACRLLPIRGCVPPSDTCVYQELYGDGSTTSGFLGRDTLTLTPADVLPSFVFGCGERNLGLFGAEAGLLGLDRSPLSLPSQASPALGDVFSYCLPSFSAGAGDLTFGPVDPTAGVSYTPMVTDARAPSLYFVQLTSVAVGGQALPVPPAVFAAAGTIVDSGTVITRLPRAAYAALRAAFRRGMARYKEAAPAGILDTCYDFSGLSSVAVPTVALGFAGGATVELGFSNVMVVFDNSRACLAFAGNADDAEVGIVGNVQQASMRVVYDVGRSRIGFGAAAC